MKKEEISVKGPHVALMVVGCWVFEQVWLIVALVSPIEANVALNHLCPTELPWATPFLVSF